MVVFVFVFVFTLMEDSEVSGPGQWDGSAPHGHEETQVPSMVAASSPWASCSAWSELGHRHICALAWGKVKREHGLDMPSGVKLSPGNRAHPFHSHSSGDNIVGVVWSH